MQPIGEQRMPSTSAVPASMRVASRRRPRVFVFAEKNVFGQQFVQSQPSHSRNFYCRYKEGKCLLLSNCIRSATV